MRREHSRELVLEQTTKGVAIPENRGIINFKEVEEGTGVDVHYIGKINKDIYSCVTDDIVTDEVIITDERIAHIRERHPNDFERYCGYIRQIVENPDYILEANKENTAFVLGEIPGENGNAQIILKIITSKDDKELKNSIITFLSISDKKCKKYLRNKKILYKKQ